MARSADAILIVLDAGKEGLNRHREILERELETVGIRLNQRRPDVTVTKKKSGGGVSFSSTVPQPLLGPEPEKVVSQILREYKISSADVLAREEITVDQLVDVVLGNREYKPCLYLYNKIDTITIEEVDQLARMPHSMVVSVNQRFNIGEPLEVSGTIVRRLIASSYGMPRQCFGYGDHSYFDFVSFHYSALGRPPETKSLELSWIDPGVHKAER